MYDKYLNFQTFAGLIPDFSFDGISAETYWCRVAAYEKQFNQTEHKHSFYELHVCMEGGSTIEIEKVSYTISKGEFLIVPAYQTHTLLAQSEDFVKLVWGFRVSSDDASKEEERNKILSSQKGVLKSSKIIESCLDNLISATDSPTKDRLYVFKTTLATLFFEICAVISDDKASFISDQVRYKERSELLVRQVEIFVKDHIKRPLTLADIAVEFSLSTRQISRLFLKYNGKSIATYLKEERFIYAERLMRDYEMTLEDIALSVGYTDAYTFCKAFKRYYGISPGQFRRSMNLK